MEYRSGLRTIIAALVGIGIVVLVIVLLVKAFSGGKAAPVTSPELVTYATTSAIAQLYIDGPIVSDQEHRAVRITIGQNQAQIDILQGYQDTVVQSQTFENNSTGYAVFLQALNHLNFTKGNNDPSQQDQRGYCPTGDRYIYKFTDGTGKQLFRFWSTSCGQGTFGGNRPQVIQLFERQIPVKIFDQLVGDIPIG